jgi:hypothetical protein
MLSRDCITWDVGEWLFLPAVSAQGLAAAGLGSTGAFQHFIASRQPSTAGLQKT